MGGFHCGDPLGIIFLFILMPAHGVAQEGFVQDCELLEMFLSAEFEELLFFEALSVLDVKEGAGPLGKLGCREYRLQ